MAKVTWRETRPGETFLGGSGILTPYRPRQTSPSQILPSPLPEDPTPSLLPSKSPEAMAWTYQPMDEQEIFGEENEGRPLKIDMKMVNKILSRTSRQATDEKEAQADPIPNQDHHGTI